MHGDQDAWLQAVTDEVLGWLLTALDGAWAWTLQWSGSSWVGLDDRYEEQNTDAVMRTGMDVEGQCGRCGGERKSKQMRLKPCSSIYAGYRLASTPALCKFHV